MGNTDLCVIARRFKFTVPLHQCGMKLVGALQSCPKHGRTHAMKFASTCIQNQESLCGKDLCIEISEGLRKGTARAVSLDQRFRRSGLAQQLPGLIHQWGNRFVQHDAADRKGRFCHISCSWRINQLAQLATGGKAHMVDLGKVVVFRRQPEDGGVRIACRRCLARMSHGGGSLEWRKKRPAKESHLLAGNDRSRALCQRRKRICCGRRRGGVLLREQPNQVGPMRRNRWARGLGRIWLDRAIERPRLGFIGAVVQK